MFGSKRPPRDDDPKRTRAKWFQSWAWTGASFVGGVGIGGLLLTELRLVPFLAILAGFGVYFTLAFLLPKALYGRAATTPAHDEAIPTSDDPRVDLLVEAHQHVATIGATRTQVPLPIGETIHILHAHAQAILEGVSAQPALLNANLRFFTYYLPSTADLVMDRIKLAPYAGAPRLTEIDQTLERLVQAFAGFEAAVRAPDLYSVDLDIELLDQSLDADLPELKP